MRYRRAEAASPKSGVGLLDLLGENYLDGVFLALLLLLILPAAFARILADSGDVSLADFEDVVGSLWVWAGILAATAVMIAV